MGGNLLLFWSKNIAAMITPSFICAAQLPPKATRLTQDSMLDYLRLKPMKKAKITSTNKTQFFNTLRRAALPLSQTGSGKSGTQSHAGYSDRQTRSHTSVSAVAKRGGKSH